MKFTEEQFNKLVELQEKEYPNNVYSSSKSGCNNIGEALKKYDLELYRFVVFNDLENQVVALMNPRTREWAHEQYVEKEKKYVWQSKQETEHGEVKRLYEETKGCIADSFVRMTAPIHEGNLISEAQVKKWGYNPEMFDKEEVR